MPDVSAAHRARRVPRTSSNIACRASITLTSVPSQSPSARRRQASLVAQPSATIVARLRGRHDASEQVRWVAASVCRSEVESWAVTELDENVCHANVRSLHGSLEMGNREVCWSGKFRRTMHPAGVSGVTVVATPGFGVLPIGPLALLAVRAHEAAKNLGSGLARRACRRRRRRRAGRSRGWTSAAQGSCPLPVDSVWVKQR